MNSLLLVTALVFGFGVEGKSKTQAVDAPVVKGQAPAPVVKGQAPAPKDPAPKGQAPKGQAPKNAVVTSRKVTTIEETVEVSDVQVVARKRLFRSGRFALPTCSSCSSCGCN